MNWRIVRAVARKDLQEVRRNRMAWGPALIVPLIFVVIMPLAMILLPSQIPMPPEKLAGDLALFKARLPAPLLHEVAGLSPLQTMVVLMTGYLLAPMFLILPLMLSSIVGADSFVGEKERKTLEALLYTPASDAELFLGKTLAAVVPAILLAWISFVVYMGVVNAASWPLMGRFWFPPPAWWPLMLWVAPAIATMGMAVTVLISARVSTFMEANQMSGSLVLVILAMLAGQATGVLYLSTGVTMLIGTILWLIDGVLIRLALRVFSREALLTRG